MNSWQTLKLGDILKVKSGKDQKTVECENGKYQILGTGGEIGRTNSFLYDKPSVLIGRKGTIDKPFYKDEPFWTVDTLFYTEIKDGFLPKYLFYLFKTINWRRYNEASGVPSLTSSTIEKIKVRVPDLETQQKIVQILDAWNKSIGALEEMSKAERNYFNAQCKGLLSRHDSLAKSYKLSEICFCKKGSGLSKEMLARQGIPCVLYGELYTRYDYLIDEVFSKVPKTFTGIKSTTNDILIPASTTTNGRDLAIASVINQPDVLLGGDINIFRIKDANIVDGTFLALYLRYIKWREIASKTQGITIVHLYGKDLLDIKIKLFPLDIQKKIVNVINCQRKKISTIDNYVAELKRQRKYLLNHLISGDLDVSNIKLEKGKE